MWVTRATVLATLHLMGNCGKCIILSLHCTHLGTGVRATVEEISMEVEDLGLPAAKKSANFRAALIHLGIRMNW